MYKPLPSDLTAMVAGGDDDGFVGDRATRQLTVMPLAPLR
jgi:hypothetical protein